MPGILPILFAASIGGILDGELLFLLAYVQSGQGKCAGVCSPWEISCVATRTAGYHTWCTNAGGLLKGRMARFAGYNVDTDEVAASVGKNAGEVAHARW